MASAAAGPAASPVLYECSDGVALITLNMPERMNPWGVLAEPWFDALDRAATDPACRVIVVTGTGRAWCAGADIAALPGAKKDGGKQAAPKLSADVLSKLREGILLDQKGRWTNHAQQIPKPVIACINGAVAGGGFSQMMHCDIRFAIAGVPFTSAFAKRGLIAEMGVNVTLVKAVGMGTAMDLMLSSRKFYSEEAQQLGILQRVFPTKEELLKSTMAYARDIAENVPPSSLAVIKQQLLRGATQPMMEAMRESNQLMLTSFTVPEHKEGVQSFLQKRKPNFPPYSESNPLVVHMNKIQASKL